MLFHLLSPLHEHVLGLQRDALHHVPYGRREPDGVGAQSRCSAHG